MSRKKKTVGPIAAEADLLEEAADTKLRAAQKMAKANAMLDDSGDDESTPLPDPRPSFVSHSEPEPEPMSRIEQILEDMKGQGKVEIFKLVGGVKSKVGVHPIEEYPEIMETVAHEHGGGTYRVVIKDERGLYVASDTQTYDAKSYGSGSQTSRRDDSDSLASVLERMDRKEEAAERRMEAMRQENMKLLLTLVESSRTPKSNTSEMIEMMKFMREAQGETRSPMDHIKEVLELANVVREEAGAVEPEHPLVAAIDKIFKTISPLIGAWAAKTAAPPSALPGASRSPAQITSTPPKPVAVAHAPSASEAALTPAPTPAPAVVDPRIKQYAVSLLGQAESGATAESIGEAILNLTPEANYDELDAMVGNPQFVALLIDAEPLLARHQKWLAELSVYITNQLTSDPEPEAETTVTPPAPNPEPSLNTAPELALTVSPGGPPA